MNSTVSRSKTKSDFQARLAAGAAAWEKHLTKDQRNEIRYAGLDNIKAYRAFRKYDINKLTMKEISSIARVAAMGIF